MAKLEQVVQDLKKKYGIKENGTYSPEMVVSLRKLDEFILKKLKTVSKVERKIWTGMGVNTPLEDIIRFDYKDGRYTYWDLDVALEVCFNIIGGIDGFDTKVNVTKIKLLD